MSNSIDFYKRIFLHVIPARVAVPRYDGVLNMHWDGIKVFEYCRIPNMPKFLHMQSLPKVLNMAE